MLTSSSCDVSSGTGSELWVDDPGSPGLPWLQGPLGGRCEDGVGEALRPRLPERNAALLLGLNA